MLITCCTSKMHREKLLLSGGKVCNIELPSKHHPGKEVNRLHRHLAVIEVKNRIWNRTKMPTNSTQENGVTIAVVFQVFRGAWKSWASWA